MFFLLALLTAVQALEQGDLERHDDASDFARVLQGKGPRGRIILKILYLIVLSLCFVVPIFYYFRIHCEDRQERRHQRYQRQLAPHDTHVGAELLQRQQQQIDETRAARRKYREEKKARLVKLLGPVQLRLQKEHFPRVESEAEAGGKEERQYMPATLLSDRSLSSAPPSVPPPAKSLASVLTDEDSSSALNHDDDAAVQAMESGSMRTLELVATPSILEYLEDPYVEETTFIVIPKPGLPLFGEGDSSKYSSPTEELRRVPNLCAICISNYEVSERIVWSSNPKCEHVFHQDCILKWLMKQRGRPMCPCCRRVFVVDPMDEHDVENDQSRDGDASSEATPATLPNDPTNNDNLRTEPATAEHALIAVARSATTTSSTSQDTGFSFETSQRQATDENSEAQEFSA